MPIIINMQRRLAETGRIRIGQQVSGTSKNGKAYTAPKKLETFRLTSTSEKAIEAVAVKYGGKPQIWKDAPVGKQWELFTESSTLDVLIPPEAMSFSQFFELWSGGGCQRRCNGIYQIPSEEACACDPDNRECKPHTRLSIMLADLPGAGLWRLDTQGWNAMNELGGAFELAQLISNATGRAIVPGVLRLDQREVKRPDEPTRKFAVPVLDFDVDMNALARGTQAALQSGLTPVPDIEPTRSFAEELEAVNSPEEKPKRANSAEPVRSTGIKPHARGELREDEEYFEQPELASPETLERINEGIAMLDEAEVATFKSWWKENIPMKAVDLTMNHAVTVERHLMELLNVEQNDNPQVEVESSTPDIVKPDEIFPPLASDPQVKMINALAAKLDLGSRAAIHTRLSEIVGEKITSVKNLTKSQAHKVIDQFQADLGEE